MIVMECVGVALIVAKLTCTTVDTTKVVDSFCQRAFIIKPSRQDTRGTLKQILRHNRRVRTCPGK